MAKHEIPCSVLSGVCHVPGAEGTLSFGGRCLTSEMAPDMDPPFFELVKILGTVEDVQDTRVAVTPLSGRNDECVALSLLQQVGIIEACQSSIHGA
jgi:hypothetical protein